MHLVGKDKDNFEFEFTKGNRDKNSRFRFLDNQDI